MSNPNPEVEYVVPLDQLFLHSARKARLLPAIIEQLRPAKSIRAPILSEAVRVADPARILKAGLPGLPRVFSHYLIVATYRGRRFNFTYSEDPGNAHDLLSHIVRSVRRQAR